MMHTLTSTMPALSIATSEPRAIAMPTFAVAKLDASISYTNEIKLKLCVKTDQEQDWDFKKLIVLINEPMDQTNLSFTPSPTIATTLYVLLNKLCI